MSKVAKRRRGTAIVDTEKGILVTAGRGGVFILPGGGAGKHETRTEAAVRELREETGLKPYYVKYLFRYTGRVHKSHGHGYFRDYHTVCLIRAAGDARPRHEIKHIAYYKPGSEVRISGVTKEIIEKYYAYKKRGKIKQRQTSIIHRILEWLAF
jgi:8-oxo-dGTP diphosphatase